MVSRLVDGVVPPDCPLPPDTPPEDETSAVKEVGTIPNDHMYNDVMDTARLSSQAWSVVSALYNLD